MLWLCVIQEDCRRDTISHRTVTGQCININPAVFLKSSRARTRSECFHSHLHKVRVMGSACESRLGVRCVKPQVQRRMVLRLQQTFLQRAFRLRISLVTKEIKMPRVVCCDGHSRYIFTDVKND